MTFSICRTIGGAGRDKWKIQKHILFTYSSINPIYFCNCILCYRGHARAKVDRMVRELIMANICLLLSHWFDYAVLNDKVCTIYFYLYTQLKNCCMSFFCQTLQTDIVIALLLYLQLYYIYCIFWVCFFWACRPPLQTRV